MTDVSKLMDALQERIQQSTVEEIVDVPVPQVEASCAQGVTLSFSEEVELDHGRYLEVIGSNVALASGLFNFWTHHARR